MIFLRFTASKQKLVSKQVCELAEFLLLRTRWMSHSDSRDVLFLRDPNPRQLKGPPVRQVSEKRDCRLPSLPQRLSQRQSALPPLPLGGRWALRLPARLSLAPMEHWQSLPAVNNPRLTTGASLNQLSLAPSSAFPSVSKSQAQEESGPIILSQKPPMQRNVLFSKLVSGPDNPSDRVTNQHALCQVGSSNSISLGLSGIFNCSNV